MAMIADPEDNVFALWEDKMPDEQEAMPGAPPGI
jgi:hypothetical protein